MTKRIKELMEKVKAGQHLSAEELDEWNEYQTTVMPVLKGFDAEMKVFNNLPKLESATADDAHEIERSFQGWHQMKRLSHFQAAQHVFWLYRYWCFDETGKQIRGAWTKLYQRLGVCRATAVEYRETAKHLLANPEVFNFVTSSKMDELSRLPHGVLSEALNIDDDGNPVLYDRLIADMDETELRQYALEQHKQLQEKTQVIKNRDDELDETGDRVKRLENEKESWRRKYERAVNFQDELGYGVARIRAGLGELRKIVETIGTDGAGAEEREMIEQVYTDLLSQVTDFGRKAGIVADTGYEAEPADMDEVPLDAFKKQLKASGVE